MAASVLRERFVSSVRRECLEHLLLICTRSITRVPKEYVAYFDHLRQHQGFGQWIPEPSSLLATGQAPLRVTRVPVLGGSCTTPINWQPEKPYYQGIRN